MADEIVAKYRVDVSGASAALDQLAAKTQKTGQTLDDSFNKGSDGAKRLNTEMARQPKTIAELEVKLRNLKELLRDDTQIGTQGFKQVTAAIKETEKEIDKANGKLAETAKQGNSVIGTFKNIAAAVGIAFGVQQLISFGKEAVELSAKAEGVKRAFDKIGSSDMLQDLRNATRGTVSDLVLMQNSVKADNFKIPLQELGSLFQFAQARSRATGESVDYLVDSIILGIGRKSIPILDNLGISAVELREKLGDVGKANATIGDVAAAVGKIAQESLEKTGIEADTTADRLARNAVAWERLQTKAGDYIILIGLGLGKIIGLINDEEEALIKLANVNNSIVESFKNMRQESVNKGIRDMNDIVAEMTTHQEKSNKLQAERIGLETRMVQLNTGSRASAVINEQNAIRERLAIIKQTVTYLDLETIALKQIYDEEQRRAELDKLRESGIKNVFYYTEAIKDLNEQINAEGTEVANILPLIKQRTELEEKLKEVIGEETLAMKALREENEKLEKIERARADALNKAQEAEAERLLKQEEDNAKERVQIAQEMAQMLIEIEDYLARSSNEILDRDLFHVQSLANERIAIAVNAAENHVINADELAARLAKIDEELKQGEIDAQEAHNQRIFELNKDLADRNADLDEEELKKEEEKKEREMRLFEAFANTTVQLIGMVSQAQQESYQRDLDNLQERLDQGLISDEEYDKEKRNLLRKQNEAAKQAAIFQAIINTAVAVTSAAGVPVIGFALAILAGILGAAQIALITSQQPPAFAKGVVDLQGEGTGTSDSISAKLSKGESVITAKETSKHKGLLEAMNKGLAEKYILSNYVKPALDSAMLSGFADMGKSAEVNGLTANLKDHNIIAAMDRHRAADVAGFKMLAAKLDRRQPKRGGYA